MEEQFPINNLNDIKLNQKEWKFFSKLNEKLLRWAEHSYNYTDYAKDFCVEFLKKHIKHEFKQCDTKETYIIELEQYLVEFNFGKKSVFCIMSIRESDHLLPNLIPGDVVNIR